MAGYPIRAERIGHDGYTAESASCDRVAGMARFCIKTTVIPAVGAGHARDKPLFDGNHASALHEETRHSNRSSAPGRTLP